MRPKKANFRLSDGVHKPDRNFAFSGRIRPRLRHFRLVKATSLVQTVGSANLIARYEERGSDPKPGSWANCDELGSPYQFFPRYG